jgi:hypothetical protein
MPATLVAGLFTFYYPPQSQLLKPKITLDGNFSVIGTVYINAVVPARVVFGTCLSLIVTIDVDFK